ncbi:hypothetical protein R5W23_004808 [Gemmata sp. JC673]|uniref:MoxR-vWA-beta-propeller ternary system domain-containing protein n=1 Tax=Gemmata algarum TaxID=2975278 RepID=A0ABU5FA77_9BACT|nr:hypothetical protein [Gemmata algarum]MDY3563308.1 hypothetical protein [Gemmata algarum]
MPVRLTQREEPLPADAFLLLADGPAPLAAACGRLGEVPQVFATRGGFLLVPQATGAALVPGALRLRRLASDLFIPSDADLLPTLLADEMAALTRDRGLIVLPGGLTLAFDATAPLSVSRWLAPARVRRAEWVPLPRRPARPATISVIERPAPPVGAVLEVLGGGAPGRTKPLPGLGESEGGGASTAIPEEIRPPSGSAVRRVAAGAGLAAAGALAWLGKQLGAEGLARLGGGLARRALELVPRLSERLLGEQEAALRDVLRELQNGNVEKGLRHAPPAVADPDQPARVGTDARLAARDPRYSLRDLIGGSGGTATAWLGGGDVWAQLANEYRRLAAEAAARGDHRRAAYLYGVLLRDLRAAANVLQAGGHYRDAGLLYRDRLKDPQAAAAAFEQGGDHDEALRLYDQLGEFERAGDLLRKLGEEERAVRHYVRAAEKFNAERRFLAAGDLLRNKAHCRDGAVACYRRGWESYGAEAIRCAERLFDEAVAAGDQHALRTLWAEAEPALADRPLDAGRFFNYALRTAEEFLPPDARADLADRAKLVFAAHLRTRAIIDGTESHVAAFFPANSVWPPPVGRDAAFASRKQRSAPRPEVRDRPTGDLTLISPGPVTAAVVVRGTFDVIVAGAEGIVYWRVAEGRTVPVWNGRERVTALSSSAGAEVIFAVTHGTDDTWAWNLRTFTPNHAGAAQLTAKHSWHSEDAGPPVYLQPAAVLRDGEHRVKLATRTEYLGFAGPHLRPDTVHRPPEPGATTRLLVDTADGHSWSWAGEFIRHWGPNAEAADRWYVAWAPLDVVDAITPHPGVLEITAVASNGEVRWREFDARTPDQSTSRSAFDADPKGYSAACLVTQRTVAAVTNDNELRWLRVSNSKLVVLAALTIRLPARVFALIPTPDTYEVVVLLADGYALRVRKP